MSENKMNSRAHTHVRLSIIARQITLHDQTVILTALETFSAYSFMADFNRGNHTAFLVH
jgi:hypothetical protein